jgi:hypothetical protein
MIIATTRASAMRSFDRLDAWYFLSPGAAARRRLEAAKEAGLETRTVAGTLLVAG